MSCQSYRAPIEGRNFPLRLLHVMIYISSAVCFQSLLSACTEPSGHRQASYSFQFSPQLNANITYTLRAKQIMSQQVRSIPSAFVQDMKLTWRCQAIARDSATVLLMQCDQFFIRSRGKDMDITYDSEDSLHEQFGVPGMASFVSRQGRLRVQSNGYTQIMNDSLNTSAVDSEAFALTTPLFCRLPDAAVSVGNRWGADYTSIMGFIPLQVHCDYTLLSVRDGKATLAIDAHLKTSLHTAGQKLFVANGSGYQKGKIEIRLKDGIVTSSSFVQFLSGEMDMSGLKVPFTQGAEIRITGTVEQ